MPKDYYLSDSEDYFDNGPFASREDAIAEGYEIYKEGFFTGIREDVDLSCSGHADHVIEHMDLWLNDRVGEAAEGCFDPTKEQQDELDVELAKVIESWVDRHGLQPTCFCVVDIQQHEQQEQGNE